VLIIRERPPRSLLARLLPALLLMALAGALLVMRTGTPDWPGLMRAAQDALAQRSAPPFESVTTPATVPPEPGPEAAASTRDPESDAAEPSPAAPADSRPEAAAPADADAAPAADETRAALAEIERQAQLKKAEQEALEKLKEEIAQEMPPPPPPAPLLPPWRGFDPEELAQLRRRADALHRQQFAEMRQMMEEATRWHNQARQRMGLPPLELWDPFGPDADWPPFPPAPLDLPDLKPNEIRTFRFGPDGQGRGEVRRFVSPDGSMTRTEIRLNQTSRP
jgi:hypothetical protein